MAFEENERSTILGRKLNVGGGKDPSYRYSVPLATVQNLNKGAYQETLVNNLRDVVKSVQEFYKDLKVEVLLKFLGSELACSGEMNKAGIPKLKGEFPAKTVNEAMCTFFDLFVLCPKCKKPETIHITNKRRETIYVGCKVCGGGWPMTNLAVTHKFYKAVQKNAKIKEKCFKAFDGAFRTNKSSKDKKKKSKSKRKKLVPLKAFVAQGDKDVDDILKHLAKLKLSDDVRMSELVQALFGGCESHKDVLKALNKNADVLKVVTHKSKEDMEKLTGFLCHVGSTKTKTLKTLFAAAVAADVVWVNTIQEWYESPYGSSLGFKGLGGASVLGKDVLAECKASCAELMEYLKDIESSDESSSDSSDE